MDLDLYVLFRVLIAFLLIGSHMTYSNSIGKLVIKGDYTTSDSIQIVEAYVEAKRAVSLMADAMERIWQVDNGSKVKFQIRADKWRENEEFSFWLGRPEKIGLARRKIRKMNSKFHKKFTVNVTKDDRGKCKGWIGAWVIPGGRVRIKLCNEFFYYKSGLQEKILIHEIGHESMMLFHHRIHYCGAAIRAASSARSKITKRSPENYAWLAMSFLGFGCGY